MTQGIATVKVPSASQARRLTDGGLAAVVLTVSVIPLAGCGKLLGVYDGPYPATNDITSDVAVVRDISPGPGVAIYVADRVRFLASNPHDVNRLVELNDREVPAQAAELHLSVGDTIRFSSRYEYTHMQGFAVTIPDWPGPGNPSYFPVARHVLTAISR